VERGGSASSRIATLRNTGLNAEHWPELAAQRRGIAGVAALSGALSIMPQF
jgi:hypothetical protein